MDNLSLVIFKEMTPKKGGTTNPEYLFIFLLNKAKLIPKFPKVCMLQRSLVPRASLPQSTSWILIIYNPKYSCSLKWFSRGTSRMETEATYRVLLVGDSGLFIERIVVHLREELLSLRCPNSLPNKPRSTYISTSQVFTFSFPYLFT